MITIEQCRAARGLLGWTQQDLADACGLSKTAINNFEKGHSDIKNESLRAIRMAFESADIEFMHNDGLRRKTENVRILKGAAAFEELLEDIGETLRHSGGEVLISHVDEATTNQLTSKQLLQHLERMKSSNITERVICPEGSSSMLASPGACRWLPKMALPTRLAMFVYDQKVALQLWDNSMILIIDSRDASHAERLRFEHLWAAAEERPGQTAGNKKTAG